MQCLTSVAPARAAVALAPIVFRARSYLHLRHHSTSVFHYYASQRFHPVLVFNVTERTVLRERFLRTMYTHGVCLRYDILWRSRQCRRFGNCVYGIRKYGPKRNGTQPLV